MTQELVGVTKMDGNDDCSRQGILEEVQKSGSTAARQWEEKPDRHVLLDGRRRVLWVALIIGFLLLSISRPTHTANAQSDSNTVVGDGTPASCTEAALRAAVKAGGNITFDCGGPKTFFLNEQQQLTIFNKTIIDGGGQITISGNNQTRIFYVTIIGDLTVRNMTLTNGYADNYGGGVWVSAGGSFTAENVVIQNNKSNDWAGSAIYAEGDGAITLNKCIVQENETTSYGAINSTGPVTVVDSILRHNSSEAGGGAMSVGGAASIVNSQFFRNFAIGDGAGGGAVYVTGSASVSIENSNFEANTAEYGGGIANQGELYIHKSSLASNFAQQRGGAIVNSGAAAFLYVTASSLVRNNTLGEGGAVAQESGSLGAFTNVTISGNGSKFGGGLWISQSEAFLNYVTLSSNKARGGIGANLDLGLSKLTIRNTILAQAIEGPSCYMGDSAVVINQGHNFHDDESCQLNSGTDVHAYEAGLDDLADNGGHMVTHYPLPNSPVVDSGSCQSSGLAVDQRGAPRPAGNACDIGAIEFGSPYWKANFPLVIR